MTKKPTRRPVKKAVPVRKGKRTSPKIKKAENDGPIIRRLSSYLSLGGPKAPAPAAPTPIVVAAREPGRIAALLLTARTAHARYRAASGRLGKDGKVAAHPRLTVCGAAIQDALTARLDAHRLDPTHTDAAWIEDAQAMKGQTHEALADFYVAYLT